MHALLDEFVEYLETEDREKCVDFVLAKLDAGEIDIVTLYTEILTPALNDMKCEGPAEMCIWKEHIQSSIVRTVVECCFPYVIKERKARQEDRGTGAMVICPPEELHEIGARMAADFFTLAGYDVTFVGANTPKSSFLSAIKTVNPRYAAISVSNYYNLLATKKIIDLIRVSSPEDILIVVGGNALAENPGVYKEIGADMMVQTFEDIEKLRGRY